MRSVLSVMAGLLAGALLCRAWCLHFAGRRPPELFPWVLLGAGSGGAFGLLDAFLSAWVGASPRAEIAARLRLLLRAVGLGAAAGVWIVVRLHSDLREPRHFQWVVCGTAALTGGLTLWARSTWGAWARARAAPRAPRPEPSAGPGPLDLAWTLHLAAGLSALAGSGFLFLGGRELVEQMGRLGPNRWDDERAVCAFLSTVWLATWLALLARTSGPRRTRLSPGRVALGSGIALVGGPFWCMVGALLLYS